MSDDVFRHRYWHDGVLVSCKTVLLGDGYSVDLCVELYESEPTSERQRIQWTFLGVKNLVLAMDMPSMTQSINAGNIIDGSVDKEEKSLALYLAEGFLKLEFAGVVEAKH
jgi:hypothetical protein